VEVLHLYTGGVDEEASLEGTEREKEPSHGVLSDHLVLVHDQLLDSHGREDLKVRFGYDLEEAVRDLLLIVMELGNIQYVHNYFLLNFGFCKQHLRDLIRVDFKLGRVDTLGLLTDIASLDRHCHICHQKPALDVLHKVGQFYKVKHQVVDPS
jgi:hypothetical protein